MSDRLKRPKPLLVSFTRSISPGSADPFIEQHLLELDRIRFGQRLTVAELVEGDVILMRVMSDKRSYGLTASVNKLDALHACGGSAVPSS